MAREFVNTSLYNDANLVAYYKLENVNDSKGSYTLTNNGTVTFSAGKFNNAANFGSSNTSKYLTDTTNTGFGNNAQSYSAWINVTTAPATNAEAKIVMRLDNASPYLGFGLTYKDTGGTKYLTAFRLRGAVAWDYLNYATTLTTGVWYHVVSVWDGTYLYLYLNGVLVATSGSLSGNGTGNYGYYGTYIGGYAGAEFFSGLIDDTAIFSRALTASEVKSIYTSRTFQKDTNNSLNVGLVSYYKLGDTYDFYGSNNLTNNGGATFGAGKYNNAVDLGSSNSSKYLSSTSNFGINGGPCSISLWVNFYSLPASNKGAGVTSVADSTSSVGNMIQLYNNSGTMQVYGFRDKVGVGSQSSGGNFTINTGTWYNFIYTYDGTNIKVFGNGSQIGTSTAASGTGTGGSNLLDIGRNYFGTTEFSSMKIDELGIWSKALSTTEISDLYNSGNGQTMNPPIEFITAVNNSDANASLSLPITVSGNNPYLLLFMRPYSTGNNGDTLTSCQFNGVDMTRINYTSGGANASTRYYSYYMANPPAGTYNITATASVTMDGGWNATAIVYAGCKDQAPEASASATNSNSSSVSASVTTIADNSWVIGGYDNSPGDGSAGTNTVGRFTSALSRVYESSLNPIATPGSTSVTVSGISTNAAWSNWISVVSLAPYVAAAGPTNLKSWNGLAKASIKSINGVTLANTKSINGLS